MNHKATALGIMSGSSLDGLDLCLATFSQNGSQWDFNINDCLTIELPRKLKSKLHESANLSQEALSRLDHEYGDFIAAAAKDMAPKAQIIGLHGHTVFHSPADKISLQIGSAQVVASRTGIPTVGNFRMKDILLGGQGAPLVPLGEKLLFPEYSAFLNLGGICNCTFKTSTEKWLAGDIGPFNQVFNFYANHLGHAIDRGGELARSGEVIPSLLEQWNRLEFFSLPFPKSLGNDWVRENFFELKEKPADVLATFAEFISTKIAYQIDEFSSTQILTTGGGTLNAFLIQQIQNKTSSKIVIPPLQILEFKEALIFGFLGLLKELNIPNVLSSATGASVDSCSGDLYFP